MAVGRIQQASPGGVSGATGEPIPLRSPLRQRVSRQVGPHPARSLAVRATGLGAAALAVGWYLGPEDGLVPLLVLAAIGAVLGIRWARTVWDRRTVGRRIRRMAGDQPVSLGGWRVGGSGYWLSSAALGPASAADGTIQPITALTGQLGAPAPGARWGPGIDPPVPPPRSAAGARWGSDVPIPDPAARAAGPSGAASLVSPPPPPDATAGGPLVHWAPPRRMDRVPWVPPTATTRPPLAPAPRATTPAPEWVGPGAAMPPVASWTVAGAYGWRRATSGIGPFATGEEVEVLVTEASVWVSGRLLERYRRLDATIEAVADEGLAITAGEGAIRRWITLVPDDPRDLGWVLRLLVPEPHDDDEMRPSEVVPHDRPPAAATAPATVEPPPRPGRAAWDDPRAVTDDGRR